MGRNLRIGVAGVVIAAAALVLGWGSLAGAAGAPPAKPDVGSEALQHCGAFEAQGDAEAYFLEHGGSPKRNVAGMDGDGDGVACEALGAPYVGYATIGYNRRKHFLYGTATLPPGASPAPAEPPCLAGDRKGPEGPRRVRVYRVTPGGDQRVFGRPIAAEAKPASERLLWKQDLAEVEPGVYYAEFLEPIRLTPYGRSECPSFSSAPTRLPRR
jgi:hypothetical protein